MSQSEYLIVFVSILIGLGLSDLMSSLRDLVQPKRDVRWHGLPMIWAVIVLGYVLAVWWMLFRLLRLEMWYHPVAFLPVLVMVLTLYLLCAFALPDADPETKAAGPKAVDLESFYLSKAHRRWFFGTAAIFSFLFFATFNAAQFYENGRALKVAIRQILLGFPIFIVPHLLLGLCQLCCVKPTVA